MKRLPLAFLFILALAGLSKHESARMGNRYGVIGMAIALVITILAATGGVSSGGVESEGTGLLGLGMIVVALMTALVLNRDIRARGFWRAIFFYPVMLSTVVVAVI